MPARFARDVGSRCRQCVGTCIVATAGLVAALPPSMSAGPKAEALIAGAHNVTGRS